MNSGRYQWMVVLAVGWLAWVPVASGQTADTNNVAPSTAVTGGGQVVLPGSGAITEISSATPLTQTRPERLNLPQEVRQRILEFEKMRETYLAQQKELLRKLKGSTEEDRQSIRDQLRDQREAWLEKARRFRDEAQQRMEELKAQLPDHAEALAPAKERAAEAAKAIKDRPRR